MSCSTRSKATRNHHTRPDNHVHLLSQKHRQKSASKTASFLKFDIDTVTKRFKELNIVMRRTTLIGNEKDSKSLFIKRLDIDPSRSSLRIVLKQKGPRLLDHVNSVF